MRVRKHTRPTKEGPPSNLSNQTGRLQMIERFSLANKVGAMVNVSLMLREHSFLPQLEVIFYSGAPNLCSWAAAQIWLAIELAVLR